MTHDGPDMTYRPDPRFDWCGPYSRKLRCKVCGATGYPTNGRGWQEGCIRGHAPCRNGCGKMLTVLRDGTARAHPGRGCTAARLIPRQAVAALASWSGLDVAEVEARVTAALKAAQ